jgi:stringent starvation protein B
MSDNDQTPLIVVDAAAPGVTVPADFVRDDHVVLNVSWSATRNLSLGNDRITFDARFSGSPRSVSVPVAAVQGIYARESGQGMMFQDEPGFTASGAGGSADSVSGADPDGPADKPPRRPGLKVVK